MNDSETKQTEQTVVAEATVIVFRQAAPGEPELLIV